MIENLNCVIEKFERHKKRLEKINFSDFSDLFLLDEEINEDIIGLSKLGIDDIMIQRIEHTSQKEIENLKCLSKMTLETKKKLFRDAKHQLLFDLSTLIIDLKSKI